MNDNQKTEQCQVCARGRAPAELEAVTDQSGRPWRQCKARALDGEGQSTCARHPAANGVLAAREERRAERLQCKLEHAPFNPQFLKLLCEEQARAELHGDEVNPMATSPGTELTVQEDCIEAFAAPTGKDEAAPDIHAKIEALRVKVLAQTATRSDMYALMQLRDILSRNS